MPEVLNRRGASQPAHLRVCATANDSARVESQQAKGAPTMEAAAASHLAWSGAVGCLAKHKPHKGEDCAYQALRAVEQADNGIKLEHFRTVAKLGSGDVGLVELVQLRGHEEHVFAMKTLHKRTMEERNKVQRVLTEMQILSGLDHPFLAALYCTIQTETHLHFIMEYCAGGQLHHLLQTQWRSQLQEQHVKFYAAEVLLALQYLHLHGYIYRDLKPENVLLHTSGHIVLTDFDLSYAKCTTTPQLQAHGLRKTKSVTSFDIFQPRDSNQPKRSSSRKAKGSKAQLPPNPLEMTAASLPDSTPKPRGLRRWRSGSKGLRRSESAIPTPPTPRPLPLLFVAQPQGRANSLVGTEEYLAPEVVKGNGHTADVDWWAFGILLYEMLYGFTPFRASSRALTFDNILHQQLRFPSVPHVSQECQDLISALLVRDPAQRLGSRAGAEEVKGHPFFAGVSWALLHHQRPPMAGQPAAGLPTKLDGSCPSYGESDIQQRSSASGSGATGSSVGSSGLVDSPGSSGSSCFSNF